MERRVLKNKPLVEAIFELRWALQESAEELKIDPYYKILIGRIYERVKDEYPFHEQLPTATMPDEISAYIIQHRFRKAAHDWPLIQIGPGIITLNDTERYVWEDFEKRAKDLIRVLFDTYRPESNPLRINGLLLRYIDAIDFDYEEENVLDFLKENLKVEIEIYKELFSNTEVSPLPLAFDLRFSFPSSMPPGAVHLRFARGKRKHQDALIWETQVQSTDQAIPAEIEEIQKWLEDAHRLTDDWFFKMIEGELLRRFE